jgi:hypothetical protein
MMHTGSAQAGGHLHDDGCGGRRGREEVTAKINLLNDSDSKSLEFEEFKLVESNQFRKTYRESDTGENP